jgi:osmotically-inducible protein OsmY
MHILFSLLLIMLSGCTAIFTDQGAPSSALHTDRRTTSAVLVDAALELDLNEKLSEINPAARVYSKSFNRHIIVLGQAPSSDDVGKISALVASTEGIKKIYNEVTIEKPISKSQRLQDHWITTKIKSSMLMMPQYKPWRVHVFTENNVVYLVGIVTTSEEEFAVDIAKKTAGVEKVVKIFDYKK